MSSHQLLSFYNCGSLKMRKAKLHNVGKCLQFRDATMILWWHSFKLCSLLKFSHTGGCFDCSSSSYPTFVYKSTFWNYYVYVLLIKPRNTKDLGSGLAQWVSWLASTLVAEKLRFDPQPGQEIFFFSDDRTACGHRRYFKPKRTGISPGFNVAKDESYSVNVNL